jgi:hypothetical protein
MAKNHMTRDIGGCESILYAAGDIQGTQPFGDRVARLLIDNNLAAWFAGAGSFGGIISTTLASVHNFARALEIAAGSFITVFVLRTTALREIGKLR